MLKATLFTLSSALLLTAAAVSAVAVHAAGMLGDDPRHYTNGASKKPHGVK